MNRHDDWTTEFSPERIAQQKAECLAEYGEVPDDFGKEMHSAWFTPKDSRC